MLDWIKRHVATTYQPRESEPEAPKPRGRAMSGKYLLLHKYLDGRYANTVVLTLSEIEDLLGFSLPDRARLDNEWWTASMASPSYSDAWILASRTAVPNLVAQTVIFERVA